MYYGLGYLFDPTMIIIIPAAILSFYAQSKVNSTFNKYANVPSAGGYTGADVARLLLQTAGITDVSVEHIRGNLTDHYDPTHKVLRLSDSVYSSRSVAALGVAAHETGHAIQHQAGYIPLAFRSAIFPVVNLGSKLSVPLIMIGLIFGFLQGSNILLLVGIMLFSVVVLFQFVTLPVEFNASSRALKLLEEHSFLTREEIKPARSVLSAAALTYVAAAAVALSQLLRLLLILSRRNNRR